MYTPFQRSPEEKKRKKSITKMDISLCGLGTLGMSLSVQCSDVIRLNYVAIVPTFHLPSDIYAVRQSVFIEGMAFIEGCDEESLTSLASGLGVVVRPRNEQKTGNGLSSIRFDPNLIGKGYSSEGRSNFGISTMNLVGSMWIDRPPRAIFPHRP
jgi:hypothetical protein